MRWLGSLAAAVIIVFAAGGSPAWAGAHKTIDLNNLNKEAVLAPGGFGESFVLKMVVQIVYNPGMNDRRGCRLQITMSNLSKVKINMRTQITTYMPGDGDKPDVADVDLVPTGDLPPGQQLMRLYSCKTAELIEAVRDNVYAWPNVCDINGQEQSPCPVELHLSSTLGIIEPKN